MGLYWPGQYWYERLAYFQVQIIDNLVTIICSSSSITTTGYPIAINIRKKMPASHKLIVMDLNKEAVNDFVEETASLAKSREGSNSILVETSGNAKDVAAKCVRFCSQSINRFIAVLKSMGL